MIDVELAELKLEREKEIMNRDEVEIELREELKQLQGRCHDLEREMNDFNSKMEDEK